MLPHYLRVWVLLALVAGTPLVLAAEPLKVQVKRAPGDKGWKSYDTWTVANATGFQARTEPGGVDVYGGDVSRKAEAKGFFYPKKVGERWWLVDPDGHLFMNVGVCSVTPGLGSDKAKGAFDKKFGTNEKWADETTKLLRANGFNGTGSWSKNEVLRGAPGRVAYCPNWNFMGSYGKKRGGTVQQPGHTGYPKDAIFVFDPDFETFAMEHAKPLAATKDDPWLLGHFSDNELPLGKRCLDNFLSLPHDDAGYKAAKAWIEKRKVSEKKIGNDDREAFQEFVVERYFEVVSKAIKAADPNHLYLGCRFYGEEKGSAGVFRAAGKYCDVISVNVYHEWTPDFKQLADWEKWSGKPFIVSEFYAKGADSGMPNTSGAGWLVKTQKDRGLFYQNFCLGLLESGGCVGWHYFRYQDNDPENKTADASNTNSNKGLLTAYFEPYTEYLPLVRELNVNVYGLIGWMEKGGRVHKEARRTGTRTCTATATKSTAAARSPAGAETRPAGAAVTEPGATEPRIFIGTAWKDRLEELRDKSRWAETAPHVGWYVHPQNINRNSEQIAIVKDLSPLFGVRDVVIERNSIPTEEDVKYRIDLVRNTLNFKGKTYVYINALFPKGEKATADKVPAPAPELYERAKLALSLDAVPLFGLTPHVVYLSPKGFNDPGWKFLRDFSVLKGYCYDAPAELYMRQKGDEARKKEFERYRDVVAESIRYANSKGAYSIYLFSAHGKAAENVALAREVVRDLKRRNALPYAWAIEDYSKNSDLHMTPERNMDGSYANTVTGLALWIRDFYAGKVK